MAKSINVVISGDASKLKRALGDAETKLGRFGSTVLVEGRNVNGFLLVAREAVNYSV